MDYETRDKIVSLDGEGIQDSGKGKGVEGSESNKSLAVRTSSKSKNRFAILESVIEREEVESVSLDIVEAIEEE